jgi:hypothetical protein
MSIVFIQCPLCAAPSKPNGTANPVNPRIGADKGYDAHEFIAL